MTGWCELWDRGLIARAEVEAAVSKLAVAEGRYQDAIEEIRNRQALLVQRRSELEIARQQLADTVIVSPMDGAVSERQASVGQYLAAGAPVVTLVRIDPLRLRLAVPEREAGTGACWPEQSLSPWKAILPNTKAAWRVCLQPSPRTTEH